MKEIPKWNSLMKSPNRFLLIAGIAFSLTLFFSFYYSIPLHKLLLALFSEAALIFLSAYIVEHTLLVDVEKFNQ